MAMPNDPLPSPPEMTQEDWEKVPVSREHGWREYTEFIHQACGSFALLHPYTNHIWGCEKCHMMTYSPAIYFKPVDEVALA